MDLWSARKTTSGERVSPETAMTLSAYFACMRNVSEDLAKLPLIIYRQLPRGKSRRRSTRSTSCCTTRRATR
jgi:phage portal protein BeeE